MTLPTTRPPRLGLRQTQGKAIRVAHVDGIDGRRHPGLKRVVSRHEPLQTIRHGLIVLVAAKLQHAGCD